MNDQMNFRGAFIASVLFTLVACDGFKHDSVELVSGSGANTETNAQTQAAQDASFGQVALLVQDMSRPLFQMPVPGGETWQVRTFKGHRNPNAADLNWGPTAEADYGKPIVASYGGTVIKSMMYTEASGVGYGNAIVIDHGDVSGARWTTWYCHLKDRYVKENETVVQGQVIGTCGNTTLASRKPMSTHLHYEQRKGGVDQPIWFNGVEFPYYASVNLTSANTNGMIIGPGPVYLSKLHYGQQDSDSVRRLQVVLGVTPVTGYYGNLTDAAVRAEQARAGYTPDPVGKSYVGPKQAGRIFPSGYTINP